MHVLVTGGAGFIGANLCRRLLQEGRKVICIDNFSSGKIENIKELEGNDFKIIEGDITDYSVFEELSEIYEIYNLACNASPIFYQKNSIETLRTCFLGMENILKFAKENKAKVLQASTSEVYGDPLVDVQEEHYFGNVNPNGIRSCYDEGKRVAETLCCDYRRIFDMDVKIVRIFNTYGSYMRDDDGRVVSNFINNALRKKDLEIYGDGNQTRSMCYISDLIDALILFMKSDAMGPMNIGNPKEITINELAHIIINKIDVNAKIRYCDKLQDDPYKRKPDITLAKKELNWEPKVDLSEGLDKIIKYYRDLEKC
ncbi:SDR family NAD(P)-dependent oxidoreductase [Intestinibacter sp.]